MQPQINVFCAVIIASYGGILGALLVLVYLTVCSDPR